MQAAIICPTGTTDPNTGMLTEPPVCDSWLTLYVVLLVPGTGEKASDFFAKNLGRLLPENGLPVCYLNTPDLSVGDMQVTYVVKVLLSTDELNVCLRSEYVAFAIKTLAASTQSKVRVVSHSQGGSDVQWALTFWPSIRESVSTFVAIGPAWQGTAIGSLVTDIRKLLTGEGVASVFQQGSGSNFLKALAHGGYTSLVPTTSIFTATDEIVQPFKSGVLPGDRAINIQLQDICPLRVARHFGLVVDSVTQFFVLQALKFNSVANVDDLRLVERGQLCLSVLPRFRSVDAVVDFTRDMMISVVSTVVTGLGNNQFAEEPPLKEYAT